MKVTIHFIIFLLKINQYLAFEKGDRFQYCSLITYDSESFLECVPEQQNNKVHISVMVLLKIEGKVKQEMCLRESQKKEMPIFTIKNLQERKHNLDLRK